MISEHFVEQALMSALRITQIFIAAIKLTEIFQI